MSLDWLSSLPTIQLVYLAALVVGAILFAVIARRSRDLSTATLTLMVVAIAINIAVGSLTYALRLPVYLDSIGTVLVGALAGPWAGALTGILANFIWSILPIPGGAGPTAAFFAPVAAVIGLMAGFWASRGVFRLRSDDPRVGGFLALAFGIAAAGIAMLVIQNTIGMTIDPRGPRFAEPVRRPRPVDHRHRHRRRLGLAPDDLRPARRRPADPDVPHRGHGHLGGCHPLRAGAPAVRTDRVLLRGGRRAR